MAGGIELDIRGKQGTGSDPDCCDIKKDAVKVEVDFFAAMDVVAVVAVKRRLQDQVRGTSRQQFSQDGALRCLVRGVQGIEAMLQRTRPGALRADPDRMPLYSSRLLQCGCA